MHGNRRHRKVTDAGGPVRYIGDMRTLVLAAAALLLGAAATAADRPVVVELFTSQGCSSCPPADKFMEELAAKPGIVAMTLPVDIWDYLGWRDTFANTSSASGSRPMRRIAVALGLYAANGDRRLSRCGG